MKVNVNNPNIFNQKFCLRPQFDVKQQNHRSLKFALGPQCDLRVKGHTAVMLSYK